MKLIIAGSRDLNLTLAELDDILEELKVPTELVTEVVSGKARGIDTLGELWAECRPDPLPIKEFPADWDKHGRSAGYIRNAAMADYADQLMVFWDGKSNGTKHMIDLAAAKKLKTIIIYV